MGRSRGRGRGGATRGRKRPRSPVVGSKPNKRAKTSMEGKETKMAEEEAGASAPPPLAPSWALQYAAPSPFASATTRQHAATEWTTDLPRAYPHRLFLNFLDRLLPVWQALGHETIPRNYQRIVALLDAFPSHSALLAEWARLDGKNKDRHVKGRAAPFGSPAARRRQPSRRVGSRF